jgi:hypothetical protein
VLKSCRNFVLQESILLAACLTVARLTKKPHDFRALAQESSSVPGWKKRLSEKIGAEAAPLVASFDLGY